MFGIPILGQEKLFWDSEAVYNNTAFSNSTLKNKHNLICFHHVIEFFADVIIIFHKLHNKYNVVDILTTSLSSEDRVRLRSMIIIDDF